MLESVGGWDPYNVTEDADLGIRLARFGYRVATIASRTYEEAPVTFRQWLPQRRRWIKGWMQTALLCFAGRVPPALRLSPLERLAVHGIVTAGVLGLLFYPASLIAVGATALSLARGDYPADSWAWCFLALALGNFSTVVAAAAIAAFRGLRATGNARLAWHIALLPIYWGLMSFAAWQALAQVLKNSFTWEKTPHGVAGDRRTPAGLAI